VCWFAPDTLPYIITKPGNPISFGPKDERITPLPAQKFGGLCKMDQTLASEEGSDLGRARGNADGNVDKKTCHKKDLFYFIFYSF
jgi:hypothetical protein